MQRVEDFKRAAPAMLPAVRVECDHAVVNVVVLGHGGTGKTTFTEAALFPTGAITRMGKVDDGTSTSDHDPDESKRQISVSLSVLPCEFDGLKINLIDTPGYADFQGEVKQGVRAADAALVACLGPAAAPLLRPGGVVVADREMCVAGWTPAPLDATLGDRRHYLYRIDRL